MSDLDAHAKEIAIRCGLKVDWGSAPACVTQHYEKMAEKELAKFLRAAAEYFRARPTGGEDMAHWANEANAERCEIAASRLDH